MQVHLVDHGFLKTEKTGARGCNGIAIKSHTCTAKPKDGEEGEPSRHICAHKQTSKPRSQNKVGKKVSTGVRASVLVMHLGEKNREHKPHVGDGKSTRQRTVELGLLQPSLHKVLCVLGKLKVLLCETHEETNQKKTNKKMSAHGEHKPGTSKSKTREGEPTSTQTHAHVRTHAHTHACTVGSGTQHTLQPLRQNLGELLLQLCLPCSHSLFNNGQHLLEGKLCN